MNKPSLPGRGRLYLIGGNEDKHGERQVLARLARLAAAAPGPLCVLTTASSIPHEVGRLYEGIFTELGVPRVRVLHIDNRALANQPDVAAALAEAGSVFLTGGDQLKVTSVLANTLVEGELRRRYLEDRLIVAGTSAGASCISNPMVYLGEGIESLCKGQVRLTMGLDLLGNTMVDTHFVIRCRFGRLLQAVAANPGVLGLGLGEDTAVLVEPDLTFEVYGSGSVVVVDGSRIGHNRIAAAEDGEPITVEGLTLHLLARGSRFSLRQRAVVEV
ncbi:MAG TPA: cyanophycinase [Candidatus Nitrosotenuis sp.]|nr:cyanophycinase [Candidatus Nitrosotenuis sp.]